MDEAFFHDERRNHREAKRAEISSLKGVVPKQALSGLHDQQENTMGE